MKKDLLILSIICSFLIMQPSFAEKSQNYDIMPINAIETDSVDISVEENKEAPNFLLEVKWDTLDALNEKKNDFKITKDGKVGYLNADLKYSFLTDYDDISTLGNYLKIKKGNKYGVIDISGREILTPEFDKISLLPGEDGREYIVGKKDGKFRLFYNTGHIVPEEKLYTITNDSSVILARDIKPDLKKLIKNSKVNYELQKNKNESYKIEEVQIPEEIAESDNEQLINEVVQNAELPVVNLNDSLIKIGNKKFYFDKTTDFVGLKNSKGKEIIPPEFDELTFDKPCKHFFSPIVIAKKGDVVSIYNSNGKLLATSSNNLINVYKFGRVFTINKLDETGSVYLNDKIIGTLNKEDNKFNYNRTGFTLYPMHNITMLMMTLLK